MLSSRLEINHKIPGSTPGLDNLRKCVLFSSQLVFQTPALVAWVSKFCTLKPGDLILTGTPPGVGIFKKPPEFLQVRSLNGGL